MNLSLVGYKTLILVLVSNFLFIVTVTLFAQINALDSRLLSPSFSIALVLMAFTLSNFLNTRKTYFWVSLLLFIALIFINLNTKLAPQLISRRAFLPSIPEKALEQIFHNPEFANSSGFYTEYNFNYQLYANLPHRMLWDVNSIASPDKIEGLFAKCNDVYFVFKKSSDHAIIFMKNSSILPGVCNKQFAGYVLFFRSTNCSIM